MSKMVSNWEKFRWALMGICGLAMLWAGVVLLKDIDIPATMYATEKWLGLAGLSLLFVSILPTVLETIWIVMPSEERDGVSILKYLSLAAIVSQIFDTVTNRQYIVDTLNPIQLGNNSIVNDVLSYIIAYGVCIAPELLISGGAFLFIYTIEQVLDTIMQIIVGAKNAISGLKVQLGSSGKRGMVP